MASLIPGFEYDIFISYRQKDNKYDGWITEFVDNLKKELESTFKEEISVYFDNNPHDGLLETHDVDASLKEKLKCLVFIPIVSRTYCDPKSFAWEHEFKTFVEQTSKDQFGLKVKLPNSNVANRVLPVRIYDLDTTDIRLCEAALGGVMRGVEFIYSEPGVNRPLKPDDDEKINLNKTKYRNQINKVGNAIKEIVQGMKAEPVPLLKEKTEHRKPLEEVRKEEKMEVKEKPAKISKRKLLIGSIVIGILIIAAGILAYSRIFKPDTIESLRAKGKIPVVVMPFRNMTNQDTLNYLEEAIQDNIISKLTEYPDVLTVRQAESINSLIQSKGFTNYDSITPTVASSVSQKLNANVFIHGSVKQIGTKMRVNAQLINTKNNEVFKSFEIDGPYIEEKIFPIIDALRMDITNFLVISNLQNELTQDFRDKPGTNSTDAFRLYLDGAKAFYKFDYPKAIELLSNSISIDSTFSSPSIVLVMAYRNQGSRTSNYQEKKALFDKAKTLCRKNYEKRDKMPKISQFWSELNYASLFETPDKKTMVCKQILDLDDQQPIIYYSMGDDYNRLYQYEKSILALERGLEIYDKWGVKPPWLGSYTALGFAYHKTGQYKKEKRLYKKAEQVFPGSFEIIYRQAILSLTRGETKTANAYIEKYKSLGKENSWSEATKATNLARIFTEANILDSAEFYYQQSLKLDPKNHSRMNTFAYFLIDNDLNINEGLELVDTALIKMPDNYDYLHTKGWGLFKQGKYQEAFNLLDKSWNLRLKYAYYNNHSAYLHRKEAEKAVAGQK
jgi:TolB-like protein/Tfp pilus assembly protein PilF